MPAIRSLLCGQLSGIDVLMAMFVGGAGGEVIEEFSWDWDGKACGDFSLCAHLCVDRDWRDGVGLSREFWRPRAAVGDADSILWGGR